MLVSLLSGRAFALHVRRPGFRCTDYSLYFFILCEFFSHCSSICIWPIYNRSEISLL